MRRQPKGRLELTWMGKDMTLIPFQDGTYDYAWVDPSDPRVTEVRSIEETGTVGDETGSKDNLLIVGDCGDALRSIAQIPEYREKHEGQVKLVYIDPPFNTGQTFTHYSDQMEHSVWLTFMRDRIREIKPLLAPDASIWVHLDDAEVHRMRVLLDEEFGAENFIAEVVWEKADSPRNSARHLSVDQDYILVYAVSADEWRPKKLPRSARLDEKYKNPDNDPRGRWFGDNLRANKPYSLGLYSVVGPTGRAFTTKRGRYWRISKERFEALDAGGQIWWGSAGDAFPTIKRYLSEVGDSVPRTLWAAKEVGSNRTSSNEIKSLFPGQDAGFATPKPEKLLERVIKIATRPGDLVLDCFAGSGTTAAVAHKLGRRWITMELLASTAETFIIPRLTKVVDGSDKGGVSVTTERVAVDGVDLPDGVSPEDAKKFNSVLSKVAKALGNDVDKAAIKALRAATRTRDKKTVNWTGGGGFTIARLGPSMYDIDDDTGDISLSEPAVNGACS
ncbi:MAG: site-specific DNA-methyltransferase, partial [Bifidobacterium mongoliense]|nr:site-specific DNA-methyltransferase [Bifidobacterium mongoliense]